MLELFNTTKNTMRYALVFLLVFMSVVPALPRSNDPNLTNAAATNTVKTGSAAEPNPAPTPVRSASAQNQNADTQQGKQYGQPGFVGEKINLNVVNADIRDILNYITEQYGVNFIIDSSVDRVPVTVNVSNVPWNQVLESVLRAHRLGIDVNGDILRVAKTTVLAEEAAVRTVAREGQLDNSPLYTEIIRPQFQPRPWISVESSGIRGKRFGYFIGNITRCDRSRIATRRHSGRHRRNSATR
jgi:hypothetical protein